MELFYYLLCIIYFLFANLNSTKAFFVVLGYIIITRISGFESDFLFSYVNYLGLTPNRIMTSPFYTREFLYYLPTVFIYKIIPSPVITFILIDIIVLVLIKKSFKKLGLPSLTLVLFYLIFPSVLGFQNVYRQFLAISFMIIIASNIKWFKFIIPILIHNMTAVFFPVIIQKSLWKIMFIIAISIGLIIYQDFKSEISSGQGDFTLLYFLIIIINLFFGLFLERLSRRKIKNNPSQLLITFSIIASVITVILSGSQSERLLMSILTFQILLNIPLILKSFKQKKFMYKLYGLVFILPSLIFSSVKQFIV